MRLAGLASRTSRRQLILFGALGLSLAATAWVASREDDAPVAAAPRRSPVAARPAAAADWPAPLPASRPAWPALPPQARAAWGDKPPTAPTRVSALVAAGTGAELDAPESAPPFPYQLVGRMTDTRPRVVLNGPQRSLLLGVGDVVDGQWRIEAIDPGGVRVQPLPDGPSQFIAFSPS